MLRKIILTGDGSHTFSVPELDVCYHSRYGAIRESFHVFIETGLKYKCGLSSTEQINIFEVGLGTGLNVLLSLIESEKSEIKFYYEAVE